MTQERNTPRDIVFDLEDTCTDIRRHAALLRCIVTDEGLDDVVRDALVQVANGLSDAHRDLHGKFTALFEQIVQTEGQQDRNPFDDIFAAWNATRMQQQDVTDEEGERLDKQEQALLEHVVTTRAPNAGSIAAKVIVAKQLIEQSGSRWTDARDVRVLDSVLEDLTALGASDRGQP